MGLTNSMDISKNRCKEDLRETSVNNRMTNSEEEDSFSRNSSSTSLQEIDHDLQEVEQGLMTNRRRRGRAFFDSVNSMLSSVRERIEHHRPNNFLNELSDRLEAAQLAHSSRVPLNLLRSEQTMQDRLHSRSSILRQVGSQKEMSSDHENSAMETEEGKLSSTSQQEHGVLHRSSSLVASRSQTEALSNADKDLHEVLPTLDTPDEEDKGESAPMEIDEEEIIASNEALKLPETPILLSRLSQHRASTFSRSISGSITPSLIEDKEETPTFAVYSWGPASYNSLHDDEQARTVENSAVSSKSRVGRLSGIMSVSCSPTHSACVSNSGEVLTCGDNSTGAVDPSRPFKHEILRPSKLELFGTTEIRQVSCGFDHAAALTALGAVLTWGCDDRDQLGHFRPSSDSPTKFVQPKTMFLGAGVRAASVACGNKFTMVLTTRMSVLVCGDPVVAGYRPGIDQTKSRRLPGQLHALVGLPLVSIAAGKDHAVVLTAHGTAYAWGRNASGCCGRPYPKELSPVPIIVPLHKIESSSPDSSTPFPGWTTSSESSLVSIADDVAIVHAACGYDHTVLVTRSGRLLVCGANDEGQIGVPNKSQVGQVERVDHPEPQRRFVSAEAGNKLTVLLDDVGDVWMMGSTVPDKAVKRVLSGKNILAIAAGGRQCVAVAVGGGTHRQFSMTSNERQVSACGSTLTQDVESLVKSVADEMEDDESISPEGQELVNRTEELLKYPAVLNSLFLDPHELEDLYREIQNVGGAKLQRALAVVTEKSILAGLGSLQSEGARLIYPEAVRFLLHYIKFFDRDENDSNFDVHGSCVVSLCEALLNLPYEGFQAFVNWSTLYPRDMFVRVLVKPLLAQLTIALRIDVDEDGVQHPKPSRRAIPAIVAVLRWLHRASERAGIAKPEDFYCDGVNKVPLEVLYEDLSALKHATKEERARSFLICASPFLIPPAKKRDLLQIESQVSMIKIATQDARYDASDNTMEVNPFYVLEIERERLLEQTLAKIKKASQKELRKKLRVKFKGEDGVDAGGVTKEFFQLVSEELFDITSGMWTRRFGEDVTWFNTDCTWDDEGYELAGVLVGLALYNGVLIDVHFPPALYRKLLNLPLGLEDVVDPELRKGLQQLLDYKGDDVEDIFCLTFEVSWTDLGKEQLIELKPNGANIPVTSGNKEEYVLLYVKWLLVDSVHAQWEAFKIGLMRIMESSSLDLFLPEEMELLLTGSQELDFEALEANTEYEGGYTKDSAVVKNLWKFIKNADHETQMMFLKFATGTSKAPIGGLKALAFKIQRAGPDSPQLPTSHTCFNTLLLPDYGDNYDKLVERLGRAILECEGFGLE